MHCRGIAGVQDSRDPNWAEEPPVQLRHIGSPTTTGSAGRRTCDATVRPSGRQRRTAAPPREGATSIAQEVVMEIVAMGGQAVANTDNAADFEGSPLGSRAATTSVDPALR